MKIVFVSYHFWPPNFGGELIISIERFKFLVERGHDVIVLTSGSDGFPSYEITNGLHVFRCPIIGKSRFARGIRRMVFPFWVVGKISEQHFDVLHFAGAGGVDPISSNLANWLVCRIAKSRKIKVVAVHSLADSEEEMFTEEGFDRQLRRLNLDQCDAIVSVSPALHAGVGKKYPETSHLIQCGIRDDVFIPLNALEKQKQRIQFGLDPEAVVFIYLGTVGYRKGFDLLAAAFLKNLDQHEDWHLWVIGPISKKENQNVDEKEVRTLIAPLVPQKDRVKFWGRVNDRKELSRLLAISDVFVLPTHREGMPLAPLEAMSAGLPVILTKIPGVTDLANIDQVTGLFVPVGNVDELRSAMQKLANNKNLRDSMGKAARQRIQDQFGWENHINKWEQLYISITGREN